MSQHLVDSREHMSALIKNSKPHEHPALAKKYGWHILNISHPCGAVIKDHLVDTRSSVADDLKVKSCPKCGARGGWTHEVADKPEPPKK